MVLILTISLIPSSYEDTILQDHSWGFLLLALFPTTLTWLVNILKLWGGLDRGPEQSYSSPSSEARGSSSVAVALREQYCVQCTPPWVSLGLLFFPVTALSLWVQLPSPCNPSCVLTSFSYASLALCGVSCFLLEAPCVLGRHQEGTLAQILFGHSCPWRLAQPWQEDV